MLNERNIIQEFREGRDYCARPYLFPLYGASIKRRLAMDQIFRDFDLNSVMGNSTVRQRKCIETGCQDLMVTSLNTGYLIASDNAEGIKLMPDRIIFPCSSKDESLYWIGFYRNLREGSAVFKHVKRGEFGSVGFNPTVNGRTYPELCIKVYNCAYPFSLEAWEKYMEQSVKLNKSGSPGVWKLSGVTGIGNYVATRYLRAAGIPAPKVFFGTSELLVQEFIPGYTVTELQDNYESLTESGEVSAEEMDAVWDAIEIIVPRLNEQVREVIEPIKNDYWAPDFIDYDINWGNLIIRKGGFHDPLNNYVLIDPFK